MKRFIAGEFCSVIECASRMITQHKLEATRAIFIRRISAWAETQMRNSSRVQGHQTLAEAMKIHQNSSQVFFYFRLRADAFVFRRKGQRLRGFVARERRRATSEMDKVKSYLPHRHRQNATSRTFRGAMTTARRRWCRRPSSSSLWQQRLGMILHRATYRQTSLEHSTTQPRLCTPATRRHDLQPAQISKFY